MKLSKAGAAFIAAHEGIVLRAYRDPVGVVTIGTGFTDRSRAFRDYWLKTRGHRLRMGDTIRRDECLNILPAIADEEYGAAVNRAIAPSKQHHYDGATSMTFNCGPGAVKWRWAKALAAGRVGEAAALLRKTATTARGRRLAGLVRRRREEARLIEIADYGRSAPKAAKPARRFAVWSIPLDLADKTAALRALQALGYGKTANDAADFIPADEVRRFQRDHGLAVDGIIGPATLAKIQRLTDIGDAGKTAGGSGAAGGAAAGAGTQVPAETGIDGAWLLWGGLALGALAAGVFVFLAWRRGWFAEIAAIIRKRIAK